jgi:hypothetical protein
MESDFPEIDSLWVLKVDPTVIVKIVEPSPTYRRKKIQYLYKDGHVGGYASPEAFYCDWYRYLNSIPGPPLLERSQNV